MRRILIVVFMWAVGAGCPLVLAQEAALPAPEQLEAPCAPEIEANRRTALANLGAQGIWFHGDVARCMLGRLELLPAYARRVALLEQRLTLDEERDALRAQQVSLAREEEQAQEELLEDALDRARSAEAERDAWHRHPAFWFVVGALVTVVLEIAAVAIFSEIR